MVTDNIPPTLFALVLIVTLCFPLLDRTGCVRSKLGGVVGKAVIGTFGFKIGCGLEDSGICGLVKAGSCGLVKAGSGGSFGRDSFGKEGSVGFIKGGS